MIDHQIHALQNVADLEQQLRNVLRVYNRMRLETAITAYLNA